jgi:ferredoxin-NADP reductase
MRAAGPMRWGEVLLINCANDPTRAYYLEQLQRSAEGNSKLAIQSHYFAEQGTLDAAFINKHCPDAIEREWFVCGPPVLTGIAREIARKLGVPEDPQRATEGNNVFGGVPT